jgi:hypothetical protein
MRNRFGAHFQTQMATWVRGVQKTGRWRFFLAAPGLSDKSALGLGCGHRGIIHADAPGGWVGAHWRRRGTAATRRGVSAWMGEGHGAEKPHLATWRKACKSSSHRYPYSTCIQPSLAAG